MLVVKVWGRWSGSLMSIASCSTCSGVCLTSCVPSPMTRPSFSCLTYKTGVVLHGRALQANELRSEGRCGCREKQKPCRSLSGSGMLRPCSTAHESRDQGEKRAEAEQGPREAEAKKRFRVHGRMLRGLNQP